MKPLRKRTVSGESRNFEILAQRNSNRTSEFGKHPSGRLIRNNAPKFSAEDFAALARFAEAVFTAATALLDRLKKLHPNDPSLAEIGDLLKRANLSFGKFNARTQGCPTEVTP